MTGTVSQDPFGVGKKIKRSTSQLVRICLQHFYLQTELLKGNHGLIYILMNLSNVDTEALAYRSYSSQERLDINEFINCLNQINYFWEYIKIEYCLN